MQRNEEPLVVVYGFPVTPTLVGRVFAVVVLLVFAGGVSLMLDDLLGALYGLWALATLGLWRIAWDLTSWLAATPGWARTRPVFWLVGAACSVVCAVMLWHVMVGCYSHRGLCS